MTKTDIERKLLLELWRLLNDYREFFGKEPFEAEFWRAMREAIEQSISGLVPL